MSWKRRLFLLWLAVSSVWIVFACFDVIPPQLGDIEWTFGEIVDVVVVLLGFPLACLGAAIAIMWIADGTANEEGARSGSDQAGGPKTDSWGFTKKRPDGP